MHASQSSSAAIGKQPQLSMPRGELKIATVLFADIASSTEAVARLDAEDAMFRLQPAVRQMCEAVEQYGGTVVRTLGDGIMAVFGAPRAVEGHARLACEAALRIQTLFPDESQGLRVRVGLHTGQVASDSTVGVSVRSDAVHGLTVHLASRVMTSADPGEIRITQATHDQALDYYYDFQRLGAVHLKGIGEETQLYSLLRSRPNPQAGPRRASTSQLRGRAKEMLHLQIAMLDAEKGRASVVGISGDPGTGKSRLCSEFADWCRGRGSVVFEFRSQLYGHAAPLQPILELFRTCFFSITDLDDVSTSTAKISACLEGLESDGDAAALANDTTLLADFIGLDVPGDASPRTVSAAKHARLLTITRRLFQRPQATATLVLLEDLHWLDDASLEFLDELVAATVGTRILLLLNYRPSFLPRWKAVATFTSLSLEKLSDKVVGEIVSDLIDYPHELTAARDLIIRRSNGNPLFAQELARSLNDELATIALASQLDEKISTFAQSLPFNVQAIIGARIDRLSRTDKAILQICSVIGERIPLAVLERVAGGETGHDIGPALMKLSDVDFIQQRSTEGSIEYSFRHPLIQEVAYEAQLRTTRSCVHHAVALAMEEHYRDRGKAFSALIAHHYSAAGAPVKSAEHEAEAAKWIASTDPSRAIKHWRKVRDLLRDQAATNEVGHLRSLAGGSIVYLGWRQGLAQEEINQITDESLAKQTDVKLVQLLLFAQGRSLQSAGAPTDEYASKLRKALSLDPEATSKGRAALLNIALSQACAWSGLLREGIVANDVGVAGLADIDEMDREFVGIDLEQWVYAIRVRLLNRLGRFDEARRHLGYITARAAASNDPVMRQIAHHVYVDWAWCADRTEAVAENLAEVLAIAQASSNPYSHIFGHHCAGIAGLALKKPSQAYQAFALALQRVDESKSALEFRPEILTGLAKASLDDGKLQGAISCAEKAIQSAAQQTDRISECRSLIVMSVALARNGEAERTSVLLERAKRLVELTGASILHRELDLAYLECLGHFQPTEAPSGTTAHQ